MQHVIKKKEKARIPPQIRHSALDTQQVSPSVENALIRLAEERVRHFRRLIEEIRGSSAA